MTREQFLNGTQFVIGFVTHKGAPTFSFHPGHISRQTRSSVDGRIVLDDYECNVDRVGRVSFSGFTYVMGKKVKVKYKFEDLVEYREEA
jgi:hypothetical protein